MGIEDDPIQDSAATLQGAADQSDADGIPGVPTPDQTRTDGEIPDPGTLSHADTSGKIEARGRRGNLTGS